MAKSASKLPSKTTSKAVKKSAEASSVTKATPARPLGLTPQQKAFYETNGYVVVRGLFSKTEAAAYRKEMHDLSERLAKIRTIDATWGSAKSMAKETKLLHCHDVQFHSAAITRLISDPRLTSVAQSIIGPNVQLHHTKMFIKPPEKGSPFPMHQDAPFFPHEKHTMIAAIIHFDDAPETKGCLRVVPGSHKKGMLPHISEGSYHLDPADYPLDDAEIIEAEAGDVIFFSYLTIHGSNTNRSQEARTTLLVQMRDPADVPSIRAHESRGQGMMLAGIDPTCSTVVPANEAKANSQNMGGTMGGTMGGVMAGGGKANGKM